MRKNTPEIEKVFNILNRATKETGVRAYVVGGFVRDSILGIPNDDIDVVVEGSGIEFARYISDNLVESKLQYYENYGTAMIKINGIDVEFVGARKEMYERGSRKPIVEEGTLRDDQLRRDFTINAMAFSLNDDNYGELIDPFDGVGDLKRGLIRTPQDPDITFSDDPLRMFRAVRFIAKLSNNGSEKASQTFKLEENTKLGIIRNLDRLWVLSMERIVSEIEKMVTYKNAFEGLSEMKETGLSKSIISKELMTERYHMSPSNDYDLLPDTTMKALEKIKDYRFIDSESKIEFFWAIVIESLRLQQKDKKTLMSFLKMPNSHFNFYVDFHNSLWLLNDYMLTCDLVSFKKLRRIPYVMNKKWTEFVDIVIMIKDIDEKTAKILTDEISSYASEFIDWKCPVNGFDMMEFLGLKEGEEFGNIKKKIENEILDGNIPNTVDGVMSYLRYKKALKGK